MKFIRRKVLEAETRLNIVILALSCQGIYGARMALAHQYNISRSVSISTPRRSIIVFTRVV